MMVHLAEVLATPGLLTGAAVLLTGPFVSLSRWERERDQEERLYFALTVEADAYYGMDGTVGTVNRGHSFTVVRVGNRLYHVYEDGKRVLMEAAPTTAQGEQVIVQDGRRYVLRGVGGSNEYWQDIGPA